ncbi:unnamed protein product [Symbiodinium natans]|uniref:Uncharacterized protein n=1 Tax=Symbiodinium natans TaxID=878477 RepID=A0A812QFA5_9DINO|nr:unnamed protein product [Symbiodinium natans]
MINNMFWNFGMGKAMQAQQLPRQQPRSAEMEGLTPDAAAFAASMNLDGKVQQALAALDGEAQRIAIGLVDLQAARNPSAVMWSMVKRLREARAEAWEHAISDLLRSL